MWSFFMSGRDDDNELFKISLHTLAMTGTHISNDLRIMLFYSFI